MAQRVTGHGDQPICIASTCMWVCDSRGKRASGYVGCKVGIRCRSNIGKHNRITMTKAGGGKLKTF